MRKLFIVTIELFSVAKRLFSVNDGKVNEM
jgi:hypothetical protein